MAQSIQCRHCGAKTLSGEDDLCHACYQYRWRTGLPRPYVENAVLRRIQAVKAGARDGD